MHLAYVPLMRRDASTCMHADNVVDNADPHSDCCHVEAASRVRTAYTKHGREVDVV